MGLVIGLLTLLLVLDSLFLLLLILVQLPKKEAGAGLAFGGAASDALFGAGSGTVLSRLTKYGAGLFLCLSLTLSVLYTHQAKVGRQDILRELEKKASAAAATAAPVPTDLTQPTIQQMTTNAPLPLPAHQASNPPTALAATNAPLPLLQPEAAQPPPAPIPTNLPTAPAQPDR
jgi:preprotein translocase subunit SecG